jgi:hypothetical protein
MASMARRSPPLTWAAQSFRGHGRHPKSGSQAGYALPTRPLAVGSWLSLPSNTWLPSSHSVTLDRQRLHPIGAKRQSRTKGPSPGLRRASPGLIAGSIRLFAW